ncbi:MAG: tRNA (guanosine(37)-N1)-methyltransferase TrmD [Trichlorobacter sp.]
MKIDIVTLFPDMFLGPFQESIIKRAQDRGLLEIGLHQLRDFTTDRHRTVDDTPYGGGAGMLMKPEPIAAAITSVRRNNPDAKVVLLSPQGEPLSQQLAQDFSAMPGLILICGRYEGVDERVRTTLCDYTVSIGDYVLSGGELAAMVVVDTVTRLLPGALGSSHSAADDSFSDGLLEYPQYTRPVVFNDLAVPEVLLSGNHAEIARWRRQESLVATARTRPDLLKTARLSDKDRSYLSRMEERGQ